MNHPENPYSTPMAEQAYFPPQQPTGAFIGVESDKLVLQHGAVLPKICVKTNQPASRLVKRTFHWHHPALAFTIFAGVIVYVILVMVLRKSMVVHIPLSEEVFQKRRRAMTICAILMTLCGLGFVGSIVGLATVGRMPADGVVTTYVLAMIFSFILLLVLAVINGKIANILTPKSITDLHGWFSGCNGQYLQSLGALVSQPQYRS